MKRFLCFRIKISKEKWTIKIFGENDVSTYHLFVLLHNSVGTILRLEFTRWRSISGIFASFEPAVSKRCGVAFEVNMVCLPEMSAEQTFGRGTSGNIPFNIATSSLCCVILYGNYINRLSSSIISSLSLFVTMFLEKPISIDSVNLTR